MNVPPKGTHGDCEARLTPVGPPAGAPGVVVVVAALDRGPRGERAREHPPRRRRRCGRVSQLAPEHAQPDRKPREAGAQVHRERARSSSSCVFTIALLRAMAAHPMQSVAEQRVPRPRCCDSAATARRWTYPTVPAPPKSAYPSRCPFPVRPARAPSASPAGLAQREPVEPPELVEGGASTAMSTSPSIRVTRRVCPLSGAALGDRAMSRCNRPRTANPTSTSGRLVPGASAFGDHFTKAGFTQIRSRRSTRTDRRRVGALQRNGRDIGATMPRRDPRRHHHEIGTTAPSTRPHRHRA